MKYLKNNNGEAYIDTIIKFFVFIMLIVILITIIPIFIYKYEQDNFADRLVRVAELSGDTNSSEVNNKINILTNKTGINPQLDWDGTSYIDGTKVQLNSNISLELRSVYTYRVADFLPFNIPIKSKAIGTSEQFWK